MGCGSSKGHFKKNNIKFEKTNIASLDKFFTDVKESVDDLNTLTGGVNMRKEDYYMSSGFLYVPGASKGFPALLTIY